MILNRVNYENEDKNIIDDEEANNNEEEEKGEEEGEKGEEQEKGEEEEEEGEEREEEEDEEEGERKEGEEETENEDNNKKKMIRNKDEDYEKGKKTRKKNKLSSCKKILILLCIVFFITILIIILSSLIKRSKKLKLFAKKINETLLNTTEIGDEDKYNATKTELMNIYNNNGEINIIKFYRENFLQKQYFKPDCSRFTNIHINVGFNEDNTDTIIKHLSSALYHSSQKSYLHIHIMDADPFSIESLIKLKNMIYKINNNTEIIVYNAGQVIKDFKIREGTLSKFSKEYAKLYAFKAIKNVEKIIFLDADDCMVQKDLSELYSLDMKDIYGRGISEIPSIRFPVEWMEKYLYDKSHYINGGVVLVNLELCQQNDFYNKAIQINNDDFYTKTEEPAQDLINILMRKKIEFFHPRYNKINYYENAEDKNDENKWYPWVSETMKQTDKINHFYTKEDLIEADNYPVIIHYVWEKQLNKVVRKYEEDKNFYAKLVGLK